MRYVRTLTGMEERLIRRLRDERIDRDESQGQVARRLGVGKRTLSQWETGGRAPSPDKLQQWARALGLHVEFGYRLTPVWHVSRETDKSP